MPYAIRKLTGKNCYKVFNKKTKRVFSKCTTLKNAKKQLSLLRAIENNPKFVLRRNSNGGKNKTRKNKQKK
jgi:hypothetical protein